MNKEIEKKFKREFELMEKLDDNFWQTGYPKLRNQLRIKIQEIVEEAIKQERERIIEGRIKGEERLEQIKHLRSTGMPIKDIIKNIK